MKITIDAAGRVVIPKSIREQSQLVAGSSLEIVYRDGMIILEPSPLQVELVNEDEVLVARPKEEVPPLSTDTVDRTLSTVREGKP